MKGTGKRYNEGKLRYDLVPAFAQEQYVKVLTNGSIKYGDWNWSKGMNFSTVIASLERHLAAIKQGHDFDEDSSLLHSSHIMCNAAFLTEYYKIYPEGDDRNHWYKQHPKIGLDLDEVLANFVFAYNEKYNIETVPETWNFDSKIPERIQELASDKDFWMGIKPKIDPSDIPFEPHCYITSRSCPSEWSLEWLEKNGFPTRPVYTVGHDQSKVDVAKESGIDWFVDDRFENFVKLSNAGICCFLWDAPHNQRYDVGFKRIKKFSDLPLFK